MIGDTGAKHLAAALRVNQVKEPFFVVLSDLPITIFLDTHNARYSAERNWYCRREASN